MKEIKPFCPIVSTMLMGQFCSYEHVRNALKIVLLDKLKSSYPGMENIHQNVAADLIEEIMDEIAAQKENSDFAL